jgi:hypothetical protein
MKKIDLENTNEVVKNLSSHRHSPTGMSPRMVKIFQSNESRLSRRIEQGKANKKLATKNS